MFSKLWIILGGYMMLAVGCLFFFIASLPEIIDSVVQSEGIIGENHLLNDRASGIFNAFVAFGAIISPIIGGHLSDTIGFRSSNDSIAILSCTYSIAYAVVWFFTRKNMRLNKQSEV